MKRAPTIKEVARRAGVSVATVSRAVNHSGPVAQQTRELIDQVIRESGFRPNSIGRQLKTARTHTIGVLVPSLKNPVFADAVDGIQGAAEKDGYRVLLASSAYRAEQETAAVETFLRSRVDGLVLTVADEQNSQALSALSASRLPFVLMFNPVRDSSFSTISIDNRKAARELVGQLLERGHRRITMIAGKHSESDRSIERQAGFRDALLEYGIERASISEVGFESPDIVARVKALHKSDPSTTAYFCSTDLIAIATIRGLNQIGCNVPKDVSVVGFDGISIGQWLSPSLATTVQPAERMGEWAMRHLIERIDRGKAAANLVLPHTFRTGESLSYSPDQRQ